MDTPYREELESGEGVVALAHDLQSKWNPSRLDLARFGRRDSLPHGLSSDCMGRVSFRAFGLVAEWSLRGWLIGRA